MLQTWSEYHQAVRRRMAASGARVLLTGIGGDELLTSSADPSVELIDLLVQSKLWRLHQRLKIWSLALKRPYPAVLWRHVISPALPRQLQLQKKRTELSRFFAFLNPSFVEQFDLPGRLLESDRSFWVSSPQQSRAGRGIHVSNEGYLVRNAARLGSSRNKLSVHAPAIGGIFAGDSSDPVDSTR